MSGFWHAIFHTTIGKSRNKFACENEHLSGDTHFLNIWYEASFLGFSQEHPQPEHRNKYWKVYCKSSYNDDSEFCSMVRDSIGSHSKFYRELWIRNFLPWRPLWLHMFRGWFLLVRAQKKGQSGVSVNFLCQIIMSS